MSRSEAPSSKRARGAKKSPRGIASRIFWIALATLLGGGIAWASTLFAWVIAPGPGPAKPMIVEIPAGLAPGELADLLAEHQLLNSPRMFALYLATLARRVPIRPGAHILDASLSPRDLAGRLGRLKVRPVRKVTIVEGFDLWQVAERLEAHEICSSKAFVRAAFEPTLLKELGLVDSAEGFLFPATYDLKLDSDPRAVLAMLVKQAQRRFSELFRAHAAGAARLKDDLGFDERQIVTLASLVEKEAAREDERTLIAGVFLNRLTDPSFQPRQALQSDPTAGYGCRLLGARLQSCIHFHGKITPTMLRDAQNPYNTYAHPGLPPGPIANPGASALAAVLAPAENDFLYFVATGEGRHTFSRTYAEHQRAFAPKAASPSSVPAGP